MGTEQIRENGEDFFFFSCVPQIRTGLVSLNLIYKEALQTKGTCLGGERADQVV